MARLIDGKAYTFTAGTKLMAKYASVLEKQANEFNLFDAVTITGDGTVDFGAATTATAADALFGFVTAIAADGKCTVQYDGVFEEVPAKAATAVGVSTLAVGSDGKVASVEGVVGGWKVIHPATSGSLFVTLIK